MPNAAYFLKQEEPNKSCLLAMRTVVLAFNKDITETKKYGMSCFCYQTKAFCYLWADKKTNEPYFLLVDGNKLNHSLLETDDRARMKILRVNPNEDLHITTIYEILEEVLNLYNN
jgi:hypothetical protein